MLCFLSVLVVGKMSMPCVNMTDMRTQAATVLKAIPSALVSEPIHPVLKGTKDTLLLTFKMNRNVEAPGGEPAGYDGWDGCNVRISEDSGNTWIVLTNPTPAYNCNSLYSFGYQHGEGTNIPGWGGSSSGWVDVSFDITAYQGKNVKIRWAFASDPGYCTADDATLFGLQIDNINVPGVLTNNGDDTTGFTWKSVVQPVGDYWVLTDSSSHSATHSYNCANMQKLQDALISPSITLPGTTPIPMSYWVYCNMPDYDGNGDNGLEDYYSIYVSTDSIVTSGDTRLGWDYGYNGSDAGWVQRDSCLGVVNDTVRCVAMDLSAFQGQTIRLAFVVETDDNDDGGMGKGLYIDDVQIGTGGSVFSEDFESGATGWESKDWVMSVATWHPDTFQAYGGSGSSWWVGDTTLKGYSNAWYQVLDSPVLTIGVEENANPKSGKLVVQNLPNPFTIKTAISIQGISKGDLRIYDLGGRLVKTFSINSAPQSANATVIWDGRDESGKSVPAGMYIYKVKSDNFSATKKMILMR